MNTAPVDALIESAEAAPSAVRAAAPAETAEIAGSAETAASTVQAAASDPTPDPTPTSTPASGGVLGGRERIDAIDAEIIALIRRRMAVSAEIQASRMADGGRRLDLRRETEVIGRYTRPLGRPGTSVAMALLELGRGRV